MLFSFLINLVGLLRASSSFLVYFLSENNKSWFLGQDTDANSRRYSSIQIALESEELIESSRSDNAFISSLHLSKIMLPPSMLNFPLISVNFLKQLETTWEDL